MNSRAIVIGGSLGGLTVANLLRDSGWDVTVFERASAYLHGSGAGIVVHEATLRYPVGHAGATIEEISCSSSTIRTFGGDGSVLFEETSPYRFTSWTTLYRGLLSSFGTDDYVLGECLVGFDQDDDGVDLRFSSGRSERADLVVCADGISSTARRRFLGVVEPRYSGYVGWRGIVHEHELSEATFAVLADAITYGLSDHSHLVAYPIPDVDGVVEPGRRLLNYVWYRNVAEGGELDELTTASDGHYRPISVGPGQVQQRYLSSLRQAAGDLLAAPLAELVAMTPQPFLQVIVDVESTQMAFGRIAVIGDAAFAARPHAAAGTAKAAENAWALSEAVGPPGGDVASALAAWEPGQLELGRNLVRRAREIGERSQLTGTWTPGDPELRFGLRGPGD